jgi:hypothetical protein
MENLSVGHTKNEEASAIFGTSSDAIVQGLANGDFLETPDDKNQIVNQQDQQEVVNPLENEFKEEVPGESSLLPDQPQSQFTNSMDNDLEEEHATVEGIRDEPEE